MRPFVNFEVLTPREHLAAAGEHAGEGLLASVHSNVVDQFIFRLERLAISWTVLPVAGMIGALGAADVLHRQVVDYLVHRVERLAAGGSRSTRTSLTR